MTWRSHNTGCGAAPIRAGLGERNCRRKSTGTSETSALAEPCDAGDGVVGGRRRGAQIRRQRRRVELSLLRDGMDRGLVVGVIA